MVLYVFIPLLFVDERKVIWLITFIKSLVFINLCGNQIFRSVVPLQITFVVTQSLTIMLWYVFLNNLFVYSKILQKCFMISNVTLDSHFLKVKWPIIIEYHNMLGILNFNLSSARIKGWLFYIRCLSLSGLCWAKKTSIFGWS